MVLDLSTLKGFSWYWETPQVVPPHDGRLKSEMAADAVFNPQPVQADLSAPFPRLGFAARSIAVVMGASMFYDGITTMIWGCRKIDEKTGEKHWSLKSAAGQGVKCALGAAAIYASVTKNPVQSLKTGYQSFVDKISGAGEQTTVSR